MTRLQSSILTFQQVLEKVDHLKNHPNAVKLKTLHVLNQPNGPVEKSLAQLLELRGRLETGQGKGKMKRVGMRALKWPFKKEEIDKVVGELEGYKETFNLALTTDVT